MSCIHEMESDIITCCLLFIKKCEIHNSKLHNVSLVQIAHNCIQEKSYAFSDYFIKHKK